MPLLPRPLLGMLLAAPLLAFALVACGGGSSSGGGASTSGGGAASGVPASGFSVTVDRTELRFDGDEGGSLASQAVLGSGIGTLPAAIYTGALDLGTSIDHVTVEVIGAQIKFTVYPKSNLAAGTYTGAVQLFACIDAKCAQHFPGSPSNVPYTLTLRKGFKVAPATLSLAGLSGTVATGDFTVQLPPTQASFAVSTATTWISTANVTPAGFSIKTIPLPPGNYVGTVSVSVPGKNIDVAINYTVKSDATTVTRIIPDASSLSFAATASLAAPARVVNVTLPAWSTGFETELTYPTGAPQGWLSVVKSGERQVSVAANAASLAPGNYSAQVVLKAGYLTTPVQVPVTFSVGTPAWQTVGSLAFVAGGDTTAGQLTSDIQISTPNLPGQTWNASAGSTWLKLLNTSGATGVTKLQVAVDLAALATLPNFDRQSSDVAITSSSGKVAATKLTFTLDKRLPEIQFISPSTRLPGEGGPLIVRGRGFDGVADLQRALAVNGATVQSITRVNDTQLVLQVAGAGAGAATFTMNNASAIATTSTRLNIVAPAVFGYRAIPTQGAKGALYFDAQRQSLYTVNKTLGSVMRFAYANGDWNVTSASVQSVDGLVMSPDAASLVTTAKSGQLNLIDPGSLAVQASFATTNIAGETLNSLPRVAVTSNGKVFFQGSTGIGGIAYFDLATRKFGGLSDGKTSFNFYSGPWFSVSGDGDRLIIVQSASISPSPQMLYMDSSDEVVKPNPSGLTFWYEAAQSLHGERFMEGTYKVWDRDFNLVGNVVLPGSSYFGRTPVFAPDGKRAYVLAYPGGLYDGTPVKPRVYVIDTSTKLVTTTNLPVLGYFDLADYPTCSNTNYECNTRALGTISPDGKTLFFVGDANLVVAPIPALLPVAASSPVERARAGASAVPTVMERHATAPQ